MENSLYIAVDLGAGSGRVFLAGVAPGELLLEEVRRFKYPPRRVHGHLRWNAAGLWGEIRGGLRAACDRARQLDRPVRSLGVDAWGLDYGLIGADGRLLEDPVCYRDERTAGVMAQVCARMPRADLFARTGIQLLEINTLFQLYAHVAAGLPAGAARLLLIPDLVNFLLTGRAVTEYTNATTTQLVDAATGAWDDCITTRLALPAHLLCPIVPAGEPIGDVLAEVSADTGLDGVRVVAPATHDTGSAVAGTPLAERWAYISSGTWSLVGIERTRPLIDDDAARYNFTNEGGAFGTVRFLKNVSGLWILESCRREWQARGIDVDYDRLLRRVASIGACGGVIFPDDPRFLNPSSMLSALADQLTETGQEVPDDPAAMTKVVLDSLALRYSSVLRAIESLTHHGLGGVHIVGGGSRNDYLNQAAANAIGLPVVAGPAEATVAGNAVVQAIAAGRFKSLAEARRHVAENIQVRTFTPRPTSAWDEARRCYADIEAGFL
jgi:rhamnulokinase